MSATKPETSTNGGEQEDILEIVDRLIASLPKSAGVIAATKEGRDIDAIVATLGLPVEIRASVRLCPLVRDNFLDDKLLKTNELNDVSRLIQGLLQLAQFELPQDWAPGEALAVQQSYPGEVCCLERPGSALP